MIDGKRDFEAAIGEGGWLGPVRRQNAGFLFGTLVHHIGNDWPWRAGQGILQLFEFEDDVGVRVMLSTFKYSTLVIPKSDVLHWGVLERRSIPMGMTPDRSGTIAGLLLFGPIGALVGSSMDASAQKKQGDKPVIGVTYRVGDEEHAIFMEFQFSGYHKAHDFLEACLPGLLRQ